VTKEFENVQRSLAPFKVGLLHGRVKSAEKESVMAAFRANQIQALVATALIEVGRGRAERDGDADRKRRAVRAGAIAPVARAHRARRA
jgi:superfamily II DNA/RNA helicase